MRVAVAEINQETNTFSPVPTTLADFKDYGLYFGDEILVKHRGVGPIGGFLAVSEHEPGEVEILPIMRAFALAGGRVTGEALQFLEKTLVDGLRKAKPIDGVFLSLHGAMAAEQVDDVEGYLLNSVRKVLGTDIPVVVPLDHHGNVTELMVKSASVLCGHETEPHKAFETGVKAAKIFFNIMKGKFHPTVAWEKIPMLSHQEHFFTSIWPMKEWFDLARKMEKQQGVICISNFPMQPWLDVSEAGWSTVVYTDNDPDLAGTLAVKLAEKAWDLREEFWKLESVPPDEAVRAAEAKNGLVILSDTGDSVAAGAPGDNTSLLKEMLEQHITCAALVPIFDPEVVDAAIRAGKGNSITVDVGGKFDKFSKPVRVTGTVLGIAEGPLKASIEGLGIESFDVGRSVLLEVGKIKIVVSERRGVGGIHPIIYTRFGVDLAEARMVDLKTATYFTYYEPHVSEVIRVDTLGLSTSHLEKLSFTRAPRPIYPLDDLPSWHAGVSSKGPRS